MSTFTGNLHQIHLRCTALTALLSLALTACLPVQTNEGLHPASYVTNPPATGCPRADDLITGPSQGTLYTTVTPSEHFDAARTHVFPFSCTPAEIIAGDKQVALRQAVGDYPSPYNIVTREQDELFIYGGAYGDQANAVGSFVAKLEPTTLEPLWRTQLIDAKAVQRWNYPGVIAVLGDGFIYAIFGDQLAKLDPQTGAVLEQITLPSPSGTEARDVSYNGFTVTPSGDIVAKSISRGRCDLEGFTALLECDHAKFPPTLVVAVNPETLELTSQLESPEAVFGRITSGRYEGKDYIYLAGSQHIYRLNHHAGTLSLDPTWGPVPYLLEGQTPASAIALIGDYAVLQTNASPTQTPMSVVAVSQADSTVLHTFQPFKESGASLSFLPSMVSVDPENKRVYSQDAGAGELVALELTEEGFKPLWKVAQRTQSFTTLIGDASTRVIVGTDIPGIEQPGALRTFSREQVVWRDAATGAELLRSPDLPPLTSGALVTPGFGSVLYYPVLTGGVIELSVRPK